MSRICVRVFIGVSVRACCKRLRCAVLKNLTHMVIPYSFIYIWQVNKDFTKAENIPTCER